MQENILSLAKLVSFIEDDLNYFLCILGTLTTPHPSGIRTAKPPTLSLSGPEGRRQARRLAALHKVKDYGVRLRF